MPRHSVYLAPNVRFPVVKPHYLRGTGVLEDFVGMVDISAPGTKFMGTTGEEVMEDAFHGRCSVRVACGFSFARYFLAFLPVEHLETVVIPAIDLHTATLIANWSPVTLPECLT